MRVRQAVLNNAIWCDMVYASHNRAGEFRDAFWFNPNGPLPFFPNVVTLTPDRKSAQLAVIDQLLNAGIPAAWGVKDSYCRLDLSVRGFEKAIEGHWIWRDAYPAGSGENIPGVVWAKTYTEHQLAAWESAWRGDSPVNAAPDPERIFLPGLLTRKDVAILAAFAAEKIVAGAIASRTGEVTGISNLFLPASDDGTLYAGCIAAAMNAFPGCPLVGYESGYYLKSAMRYGFETIGPLQIWIKSVKA